MLKIGKGLKKKKKSKKSKHKEDELFTEEELEQYKREHSKAAEEAQENSETEKVASEEFEKFKQLTAGVDDILKKSQGNLDRIKKESFFQRKPTPSELKAQEEKEKEALKVAEEKKEKQEEEEREEESESEYEFDDKDDIFDTAYVDVLESGEVKLAYIPDEDEVPANEGPDPFDTTSAEEVLKKAEEVEKKKKLEISLGLAATVLSGRAERDKLVLAETGAAELIDQTIQPILPGAKSKKRPRKIQDIVLIGSFDEGSSISPITSESVPGKVSEAPKSLLDDDINVDSFLPEGETLITEVLVKQQTETNLPESREQKDINSNLKNLVSEFDVINENSTPEVRKAEEVEDEFDEFTALAVSSVTNQKLEEQFQKFEDLSSDPFDTSSANIVLKQEPVDPFGITDGDIPSTQLDTLLQESIPNWSAFVSEEPEEKTEIDPFDTSFAEKIQPGKCELKLLEKEILGDIKGITQKSDVHQEARILSRDNSDSDFDPRAGEETQRSDIQGFRPKVSIQITDPSGFVEVQRGSESESRNGDLVSLSFKHRDLLGGSTTDLTKLGNEPLPPEVASPAEDFSKYSDPFDTSIVDQIALPGKAELKFLEKELLSDIPKFQDEDNLSDSEFDPRKEENLGQKPTVSFDIPSPVTGDLSSQREVRPLTPYYTEVKDSESDTCEIEDPFDTSHVSSLPGKEELKIIEKELNSVQITEPAFEPVHKKLGLEETETPRSSLSHSLSDHNFNPREESDTNQGKLNSSAAIRRHSDVAGLSQRPPFLPLQKVKPDLLVVEEDLPVKALTPAVEEDFSSYIDPFDTSIAENIAPGKAELKLLERELILNSEETIKRSFTDPDFNPREETAETSDTKQSDILNISENAEVNIKPLNPLPFETSIEDDIDPFDTSIAANLVPGKAEIRILESELFGQ